MPRENFCNCCSSQYLHRPNRCFLFIFPLTLCYLFQRLSRRTILHRVVVYAQPPFQGILQHWLAIRSWRLLLCILLFFFFRFFFFWFRSSQCLMSLSIVEKSSSNVLIFCHFTSFHAQGFNTITNFKTLSFFDMSVNSKTSLWKSLWYCWSLSFWFNVLNSIYCIPCLI